MMISRKCESNSVFLIDRLLTVTMLSEGVLRSTRLK